MGVVFITILYAGICVVSGQSLPAAVSIEAVPFMAWLLAPRGGQLQQYCGASVVHEKFLLTAASCFAERKGAVNDTEVLVGTDNLKRGGQSYDVAAILVHDKYFEQTGDYNVALIKIKGRMTFGPKVAKVEVGSRKVKVGALVDVVGWGSANTSGTSLLRQDTIPVLRRSACRGGLGRILLPRLMCAGVPGEGRGDCVSVEGGPVFNNGSLLGVATPASGCARLPGLYTRLSAVRRWVTRTIDAHLSYLDYLDDVGEREGRKNLL